MLEASLASGLPGPGRLHDHFVVLEAMTPGECRSGGEGLCIAYDVVDTPFGRALVGQTSRGICWLSCSEDEAELLGSWPRASCQRRTGVGQGLFEGRCARTLLHVWGTNVQLRVWQALLAIPPGDITSYGRLADAIGMDRRASRAVGANPIGYLIPCHRVIQGSGVLGGYRWGTTRKQALLGWEAASAGL